MSGLARVSQDDFGVGTLLGVAPDVQPGVGLADIENGLINDDGDVYRRGGVKNFSAAAPGRLTFVWSGWVANQPRILLATPTAFYTTATTVPGTALVALTTPVAGTGQLTPVLPAIVGDKLFLPQGLYWNGGAGLTAWTIPASLPAGPKHVCAAAGRLLVASGGRVAMSVPNEPTNFIADDYHDLPGGVIVMGMTAIRDTAFVFTNYGLWTISNLAFDLTDALGNIQQQLQLITPELSLWHESGLTGWAGRIVAPCMDAVYLIDGLSAPQAISTSIADRYLQYVRQGLRPGGAKVWRNHYVLPIIESGTGGMSLATEVCRLDRPVSGRNLYFPWSRLSGFGSKVVMGDFALVGVQPRFIGAHINGALVDLSTIWEPSETVNTDQDGVAPVFDVESRDFPTGRGQPNHVRSVRVRYTLAGAANLTGAISIGTQAQRYEDIDARTYADVFAEYANYEALWRGGVDPSGIPPSVGSPDRFWYTLGALTLSEPGVEPITWRLTGARRSRYARVRFRCTDATSKLILHHLDLSVRQATHDR